MNKNYSISIILILILFILGTSGCLEFNIDTGGTTYTAHPTKASYTISYGYRVECTGIGNYEIHYDCDLPELLAGIVTTQEILYPQDYETITLANNEILQWNITGEDNNSYELGVNADVEAEGFLVSDLNGNNALTLREIKTSYLDILLQYGQEQSADNTVYIDPENTQIKSIANNIQDQSNTNNSFLLAKALFIWLKQNTVYQKHTTNNNVQPASVTIQLKTGDCDDLTFLYISLCRSIDIPARFIRGILVDKTNGVISSVAHAWAEVFVGENIGDNGWMSVETACSSLDMDVQINQNFGIEDVSHLRLFKDDGTNESMNATMYAFSSIRYGSGIIITSTPFIEIDNYQVLESKELVIKDDNRTYKQSS